MRQVSASFFRFPGLTLRVRNTRDVLLPSAFFLPPGSVSPGLGLWPGSECNQIGSGKKYQACNRRHRLAPASRHVSMRSLLVFGSLVASAEWPHVLESVLPGDSTHK